MFNFHKNIAERNRQSVLEPPALDKNQARCFRLRDADAGRPKRYTHKSFLCKTGMLASLLLTFGGAPPVAAHFIKMDIPISDSNNVTAGAVINRVDSALMIASSNHTMDIVGIGANDPMLDESLVLGTVFHDRNGNGVQDAGEEGIPGVRVVTAEGLLIETDTYGRFHVEDVSSGHMRRGRNFIMKVDPATLPGNAQFTTDNPLVRRITPGVPVRFDFGVRLDSNERLGRSGDEIEVGDEMFVPGQAVIQPQYLSAIQRLASRIDAYQIRTLIVSTQAEGELAARRIDAVRTALLQHLSAEKVDALRITSRKPGQR